MARSGHRRKGPPAGVSRAVIGVRDIIGSSTAKPALRSPTAMLQRVIAACAGSADHKVNPSFSAPA
jgi:hypothetical protein